MKFDKLILGNSTRLKHVAIPKPDSAFTNVRYLYVFKLFMKLVFEYFGSCGGFRLMSGQVFGFSNLNDHRTYFRVERYSCGSLKIIYFIYYI